jgi:hypothetical protein
MILPGRRFNELAIVPGLGFPERTATERRSSSANRAFLAGVVGCDPSSVPGCGSLLAALALIEETASANTNPADNTFEVIDAMVDLSIAHAGRAIPARGR